LGIAFPSLVTGKVGYFRKSGNWLWGGGVRIFPVTTGIQGIYQFNDLFFMTCSMEWNPFNEETGYYLHEFFLPQLLYLTDISLKWTIGATRQEIKQRHNHRRP